jgi:hypothetical protein
MANENVQGLTLRVTLQGSVSGSNGTRLPIDYTYEQVFGDGTGNNQIGAVWQKLARSLNNTSEIHDLDGIADFQGATMSDNNAVKFILARLIGTTTGHTLKMGGDDFIGPLVDTSDLVATGPDGIILIVNPRDGWGITASTCDGLKFATNANETYDVIIGLDNT